MADIEGMFHQVKVTLQDSNFFQFLWWPNGDYSKNLAEHRMTVHLFGATSSPSCASYALKRTAEDNKHKFSAEAIDTMKNNFYEMIASSLCHPRWKVFLCVKNFKPCAPKVDFI